MPPAVRSAHALIYDLYPGLATQMAQNEAMVLASLDGDRVAAEVVAISDGTTLLVASVHFDPQDGLLRSFVAAGRHFRPDANQAFAAAVASNPSWTRRELLSWLARRGGQDDSRRMAAGLSSARASSKWLRFLGPGVSATDWRLRWDDDVDRSQEKLVRWTASLRTVAGGSRKRDYDVEFDVFSGEVVSVLRR